MVVENKPGAGGSIAAQAVKAAPADGYTLMFTISTTMIMNRVLYKNLPYDADKDFVLISSMSAGHLPLVASKATGATNLKEFVEYARKNKVSIGTYAAGSYSHIAVAELNKHFGLQMEAVHYRGEAPMWQDLAAGVIQAASGSYAAASNVLQSGAGRPDRRAAEQAHEQASRRCHLPRAGRDLKGLPAPGLHLPGGPDRHAARDRPAPIGPDGRRRKKRARAANCSTPSASTNPLSGTKTSRSSLPRKARSGSASSRASA